MMTGSSPGKIPIYFSDSYLETLNGDHVVKFTVDEKTHAIFYRDDKSLISLKYSPFGGVWLSHGVSKSELLNQLRLFAEHQKENGVEKIIITTPPEYYPGFIPPDWIIEEGFEELVSETNQFIDLGAEIHLHKMELRKLKNLSSEDWELKQVPLNSFQKLHHFLSFCRSQQQLEINIVWQRLRHLISTSPKSYEGWVLARNEEWAAAVIMVRVTDSIVYYYLPGTHQKFKNASPMVRLINDLIRTYQLEGYKTMDLGISSVEGQLQKGLYQFKEHMGAKSCHRNTYQKSLIR